MLDTLLQFIRIDLENIVHLADTSWSERLLINMDIAIVRASVGSVNIKVY